jgi:hypothetical protein
MNTSSSNLPAKLAAARRSLTVWASAAVPVALAAAEALKDQLPFISKLLQGWPLVALSVVVSSLVTALRLRSVRAGIEAK